MLDSRVSTLSATALLLLATLTLAFPREGLAQDPSDTGRGESREATVPA